MTEPTKPSQAAREAADEFFPPHLWKNEARDDLAQFLARFEAETIERHRSSTADMGREAYEALRALQGSCTRTPVAMGDGGTYMVTGPTMEAIKAASVAIGNYRAALSTPTEQQTARDGDVPHGLVEAIGGLVSECADARDVYPDAATALEAISNTVNEIYRSIEGGVFGPLAISTPSADDAEQQTARPSDDDTKIRDFSRATLRHNIETTLRRNRDAHPHTMLESIMAVIPVAATLAERQTARTASDTGEVERLREALAFVGHLATCNHGHAHYCPNCDRSLSEIGDAVQAALAQTEGEG